MKKILIIEDELPLLKVLSDRFTQEGVLVLQAKDGAEGYKQAIEAAPDIILLDILLPLINGLDVLEKMRKDPVGKNIPVIILTNLNDLGTVNKALKNGAYDFFVKSDSNLEDLVKKVKEKLGSG